MDKTAFYAALRRRACPVFGTSLSQGQVNGLECLLADGMIRNVPLRQLAYVLATAYHETAHTMRPVKEYGGDRYLKAKPYWPYVGRGYVQLTWRNNYIRAGKEIGLDLVNNPDLAMRPDIAAGILFAGMLEGWFTGKSLSDYIGDGRADYVGARKIVNGTDRAKDIAAYAKAFEAALREAGYSTLTAPQEPPKREPRPGTTYDGLEVHDPARPTSAAKQGGIAAAFVLLVGAAYAAWDHIVNFIQGIF